jgi:hypothetical protein
MGGAAFTGAFETWGGSYERPRVGMRGFPEKKGGRRDFYEFP